MGELANLIRQESDYNKRAGYAGELQDLMDADSPYAFLLQHPKAYAVRSNLQNVLYNDVAKLQLTELSIGE